MAKINKEEAARREGMSYALRIAKEQGIDALEEDLKMRNAIGLPINVPKKALDECTDKIKMCLIDTMKLLVAITLHDQFGYGKKRLQEFNERFNFKAECIDEGYCTWEDNIKALREECNMKYKIRKNDKDVII